MAANEETYKAITAKATQRMKDLADGYFNKGYKLQNKDRVAICNFKKKYPKEFKKIFERCLDKQLEAYNTRVTNKIEKMVETARINHHKKLDSLHKIPVVKVKAKSRQDRWTPELRERMSICQKRRWEVYKAFDVDVGNSTVRHHLLQLISWPNEDGSFTQIVNSSTRLKKLGIYYNYKMTIEMTRKEHWDLHCTYDDMFIQKVNYAMNHTKG